MKYKSNISFKEARDRLTPKDNAAGISYAAAVTPTTPQRKTYPVSTQTTITWLDDDQSYMASRTETNFPMNKTIIPNKSKNGQTQTSGPSTSKSITVTPLPKSITQNIPKQPNNPSKQSKEQPAAQNKAGIKQHIKQVTTKEGAGPPPCLLYTSPSPRD